MLGRWVSFRRDRILVAINGIGISTMHEGYQMLHSNGEYIGRYLGLNKIKYVPKETILVPPRLANAAPNQRFWASFEEGHL